MSKHTPGPWNCSKDGAEIWPMTGAKSHVELARVVGPWCDSSWYSKGEALANGRLIAAAPKLLDALKMLLADMEWVCRDRPKWAAKYFPGVSLDIARDIIAIAEEGRVE